MCPPALCPAIALGMKTVPEVTIAYDRTAVTDAATEDAAANGAASTVSSGFPSTESRGTPRRRLPRTGPLSAAAPARLPRCDDPRLASVGAPGCPACVSRRHSSAKPWRPVMFG